MIAIQRLCITTPTQKLVDIALNIESSLALIGESGSGKSLTLKALLGMLPQNLNLDLKIDSPFRLLRGENMTIVPQNPFTALSPLTKVQAHFDGIKKSEIERLFLEVGLETSLMDRFASELSGGQLQRVVLAIALSHSPKLLLLDEPTTALDSKTGNMIIKLLKQLQNKLGFKILFVTHDIKQAGALCDDISIIKNGQIVESGKTEDVLTSPKNSYTATLIESNFNSRGFRK